MLLLLILFTLRWSTLQRWTFAGRWQKKTRHPDQVIQNKL